MTRLLVIMLAALAAPAHAADGEAVTVPVWLLLAVVSAAGGVVTFVVKMLLDSVKHAINNKINVVQLTSEAGHRDHEDRLRHIESGTSMAAILASLSDMRERLVRIETQLGVAPEQPKPRRGR